MKLNEPDFQVKSVALNVVKEKIRKHVSALDLDASNFSLDAFADFTGKNMVLELTRLRPAQDLGTISFQVPSNWFEHFKERFYPKSLLKRFPVKYTELKVGASAFYDRVEIPREVTQIKLFKFDKDSLPI